MGGHSAQWRAFLLPEYVTGANASALLERMFLMALLTITPQNVVEVVEVVDKS